ncbi:MAG: STAS domain-containing protein [Candidatus Omnitrophota bacterium]|jgi:anti-sigma B factor antagonist|nr:PilZ domain-containing protein [Candidatus Omnitrophota bacterium]
MPARFRESGNITILDIEGNVDINSSDIIESVGYLLNSGKSNFIFNLENVNLVDYSGLSVLAIAYKNILNHKGKARFIHVSAQVIELFKMVKLEGVFETYADEESAIRSFYEESSGMAHLRRRFKRLDMHLKIKYWVVGSQKRPKVFEGEVVNMSAAGLCVFSKYTFPVNSLLEIELIHRGEIIFLNSTAKVIWIADKELQPHFYPGMGIAFVHLSADNEKLIIDFIDKNITHRVEP